MTTSFRRESATLYQFPAKVSGRGEADRPVYDLAVHKVEFGSGWYHDAAVQAAQRPTNRWPDAFGDPSHAEGLTRDDGTVVFPRHW